MSRLEISKVAEAGELCWGVSLLTDQGDQILKNVTPLSRGVALSTAKTLKNKGFDAPLASDGQGVPDTPVWVAEKAGDSWLFRLTLVSETLFDLQLKPEDKVEDTKIIEAALEVVKGNLAKAEITWNPPEADPAYGEKESDCTVTQGHPGS